MVGDRILSDTVMGNQHGFFTIDTEPFSTENENFMVKAMRKVERHFIPLIGSREPPHHKVQELVLGGDLKALIKKE